MMEAKSQSKATSSMVLTPENYYSDEANAAFWSFSLFKEFQKCEAGGMHKLRPHEPPAKPPMPLIAGNYVHSYFESSEAHEAFVEANRDNLYQRGGKKKLADITKADQMIATLEGDPFFVNAYQGTKEAIVTGELFGLEWMGKIDCLNLEKGYFIDLKTSADLYRGLWSTDADGRNRKRIWFEEYGYIKQLALYQQLIKQTYGVTCQPFLFGVSKQDPPDHTAINFRQDLLDRELDDVRLLAPLFDEVKRGEREPERCEMCDYCRETKRLSHFVDAEDLMDSV